MLNRVIFTKMVVDAISSVFFIFFYDVAFLGGGDTVLAQYGKGSL